MHPGQLGRGGELWDSAATSETSGLGEGTIPASKGTALDSTSACQPQTFPQSGAEDNTARGKAEETFISSQFHPPWSNHESQMVALCVRVLWREDVGRGASEATASLAQLLWGGAGGCQGTGCAEEAVCSLLSAACRDGLSWAPGQGRETRLRQRSRKQASASRSANKQLCYPKESLHVSGLFPRQRQLPAEGRTRAGRPGFEFFSSDPAAVGWWEDA